MLTTASFEDTELAMQMNHQAPAARHFGNDTTGDLNNRDI